MNAESLHRVDPERVAQLMRVQQAKHSIEHVRRIALPYFLMDFTLAWTAGRSGVESSWYWFAMATVLQVSRTLYISWITRGQHPDPDKMLPLLFWWRVVISCSHAWLIVRVFQQPVGDTHFVISAIVIGSAAASITPAAGQVRGFASWALILGGAAVLGWWSQGTFTGWALGMLLVCLFVIQALHVRDQGRALLQMVSLSESLRLERDRAETERQRAEAASEAKTRFFAAASHDLRQPLHALAINAATVQALALRDGDATLGQVSQAIRRALNESLSLLDSLLEVSQLDAGAVKVEWEDLDLMALLRRIHETLLPLALSRGLDLRVVPPPGDEPVIVRSDANLLRRMVHNLVGNALKFTTQGSVTIDVQVLPLSAGRRVQVRVADTGPGIPREEQERVFEEFYQIGNPERDRSRGLGLGLAIVRRVSKLIDAPVALYSSPPFGSVFEILLQTPADAAAVATVADSADPAQSLKLASGRSVLIIDDEPGVRESLCTLMATVGWRPRAVADLADAQVLLAQGFEPDGLLVDFRLRAGASGLEALQVLRSQGCHAPAVLVTGDTEPSRITAARDAGLPVVYKPVDGERLLALLNACIDNHAAQAQPRAA